MVSFLKERSNVKVHGILGLCSRGAQRGVEITLIDNRLCWKGQSTTHDAEATHAENICAETGIGPLSQGKHGRCRQDARGRRRDTRFLAVGSPLRLPPRGISPRHLVWCQRRSLGASCAQTEALSVQVPACKSSWTS